MIQRINAEIEKEMKEFEMHDDREVEETWQIWNEKIVKVAEEVIPKRKTMKNKGWMTDEILGLMEERRKTKNTNEIEYRRIHKIIKKKCREERNKWFESKCQHIEKLEADRKIREAHQEIKQMMKVTVSYTHRRCRRSTLCRSRWSPYH